MWAVLGAGFITLSCLLAIQRPLRQWINVTVIRMPAAITTLAVAEPEVAATGLTLLEHGGELPTTIIVDADGNIRRRFIGSRRLLTFASMAAEAKKAPGSLAKANDCTGVELPAERASPQPEKIRHELCSLSPVHLASATASQAGTLTGSDAWVDNYGDLLFGFAFSRLRNKTKAEDVVQETLLAAIKGESSFRGQVAEKEIGCSEF